MRQLTREKIIKHTAKYISESFSYYQIANQIKSIQTYKREGGKLDMQILQTKSNMSFYDIYGKVSNHF